MCCHWKTKRIHKVRIRGAAQAGVPGNDGLLGVGRDDGQVRSQQAWVNFCQLFKFRFTFDVNIFMCQGAVQFKKTAIFNYTREVFEGKRY